MTTSPRILIVTYNWPPRNAIGTHRPYAWARHWAEEGAEVTILTARKRFFDQPLDLHLPALKGVRVIEVPYGKGDPSVVIKFLRNLTVLNQLRRLKAILSRATLTSIDPRLGWFAATPYLVDQLAAQHDFVVSTFGPAASHLIANAVKQANPAIFWVADYRDLWSQAQDLTISGRALERMRAEEEASVGRNADLVSAASEGQALELAKFCKSDVVLVTNGFDVELAELENVLIQPFRRSSSPIRIVYTGTIYSGYQDPTPLLEVLAKMVDRREIVLGDVFVDFYGRAVDAVRNLQNDSRFKPFLRIFGHVSREVAMSAQRDADLLLLLGSSDSEFHGVLRGKVFEYITTGRPIICVGSHPKYEMSLLLQRTGTGRVVSKTDGEEMASIVRERLQGAGPPAWFAPNLEEIRRYSRRTQALALLKEMLDRKR